MSESKKSTAIVLINIGSPDTPGIFRVAKYLSRFLGDRRIIGLPWLARKILVNCIIVPFRSWNSALRYKKLWSLFNGKFPLYHYGIQTRKLLQEALRDETTVFLGMCYGKPAINETINSIIKASFNKIILMPMFPHYASSSTGVALEMAFKALERYPLIPEIRTINQFYNHPAFINAFTDKIKAYSPESYELILFTYHSLPLKHIREAENTPYCYKTTCYETSRLLAESVKLPKNRYETAFQSQVAADWQGPFADRTIKEKAAQGIKSILIVAPSFVADCLETSVELGEEYKQIFLDNGGERLDLVDSLNDSPLWIQALKQLYLEDNLH